MYHTLEKIIYRYYGLRCEVIGQNDNVYILRDQYRYYVLKSQSVLYEDHLVIQSPYLVHIITTKFSTMSFVYQHRYFYLMEYVNLQSQEGPLFTLALQNLANMHKETFYSKDVTSSFYEYEIEQFTRQIKSSYRFFDGLFDDLLEKDIYHPAIWLLFELYPYIQCLKNMAFELLEEYKDMVKSKDTCRFCLNLHQIDFEAYSHQNHCWIKREHAFYDQVGSDFVAIFKTNVEYENIESFYLSNFKFEQCECYWIILKLLCLETWDFYDDGYLSVIRLFQLKSYFHKLNKVLKSLQINKIFLYNEDRR